MVMDGWTGEKTRKVQRDFWVLALVISGGGKFPEGTYFEKR
jgi:hypothetical protein